LPLARFSSETTIAPNAGVRLNSARSKEIGTLALAPGARAANAPVPMALLNALNLAGLVIASALPVSRSEVCAIPLPVRYVSIRRSVPQDR